MALARCDESCDSSGRWWHDYGAWQWNLFVVLALVGAGAAFAVVVSIAIGRTRAATVALALWTICAITFSMLLQEAGNTKRAGDGWYAIAILTLLGVVSIALAGGRASRETRPRLH
jgi:hypothetical protein